MEGIRERYLELYEEMAKSGMPEKMKDKDRPRFVRDYFGV